MKIRLKTTVVSVLMLAALIVLWIPASVNAQDLSLEQAIALAIDGDPWLEGSYQRELASREKSVVAATLPDPKISIAVANMAADSLEFDQEPMTQLKISYSQMFPRGDTRELRQRQLMALSQRHPYMREDREAKLRLAVSEQWLDAYRFRETIRLIEQDRQLFEHLVDVAESSYTTAVGNTRQHDLIRSQLELTRLDDRLTTLHQMQETSIANLGKWLADDISAGTDLPSQLPLIELKNASPDFSRHPAILGQEEEISAGTTAVELAKQQYKPQWGLNLGYAYRDDDPMGNERSDFVSVGLSFDLPIFTGNRQDRQVKAAIAEESASKTDRALALRDMRAGYLSASKRLERLDQRIALYRARLLQEIHEQAEASLNAYTNDVGDFSEVIRSRIAELNANIDFLNIQVERLKTVSQLNYFLTRSSAANREPTP